jgi:hypothetical protein
MDRHHVRISALGWRVGQRWGATQAPIRVTVDRTEDHADTVRQPLSSVIALSMVSKCDKPISLLLQTLANAVRLAPYSKMCAWWVSRLSRAAVRCSSPKICFRYNWKGLALMSHYDLGEIRTGTGT